MNLQEYIAQREARDPEFRAARKAMEPEFALRRKVIEERAARIAAGQVHDCASADNCRDGTDE